MPSWNPIATPAMFHFRMRLKTANALPVTKVLRATCKQVLDFTESPALALKPAKPVTVTIMDAALDW
jgi:hypothetical protein